MKESDLWKLDKLFEQKVCLEAIRFEYISETILNKAIKEVTEKIFEEIKEIQKRRKK